MIAMHALPSSSSVCLVFVIVSDLKQLSSPKSHPNYYVRCYE